MKTTLIVIQSDADHAQAKALIEKLMRSKDPADQARMVAQACPQAHMWHDTSPMRLT